jgi:hypothetical protein
MTYTKEIWKNIPDLDNKYQCSNLGRIKSIERIVSIGTNKRLIKSKILNPIICSNGYLAINFTHKKRKQISVHRIVAKTFLGLNDNSKLVVNHLDLNKQNNSVSNLEVITQKENIRHSIYNDKNGQMLLDLQTGIYYIQYNEAAFAKKIKTQKLYKIMNGYSKQKTSFIKV